MQIPKQSDTEPTRCPRCGAAVKVWSEKYPIDEDFYIWERKCVCPVCGWKKGGTE